MLMNQSHILIAPLSTEPQAVTIMLDWLLAQHYPVSEVIVVHTSGQVIQSAITLLDREFENNIYPSTLHYRRCPIIGRFRPVDDISNEEDISALLKTLYRVIKAARHEHTVIHLSLISGRKTMAMYGMVAAQLLFREQDCVWHLVSAERSNSTQKQMHVGPDINLHVMQVPVLRWSDAAVASSILQEDDPWQAIERQRAFANHEKTRRRREFLAHYLTPMEQKLLTLLCQKGMDNAALAKNLHKQEQTIANQLSRIYQKFDDWRELPQGTANRSALIAEFAPQLTQQVSSE